MYVAASTSVAVSASAASAAGGGMVVVVVVVWGGGGRSGGGSYYFPKHLLPLGIPCNNYALFIPDDYVLGVSACETPCTFIPVPWPRPLVE